MEASANLLVFAAGYFLTGVFYGGSATDILPRMSTRRHGFLGNLFKLFVLCVIVLYGAVGVTSPWAFHIGGRSCSTGPDTASSSPRLERILSTLPSTHRLIFPGSTSTASVPRAACRAPA